MYVATFDGYLHYRGVVEAAPYLTGASMVVIGHRHHRAILYPIDQRPGGKVMVNWLVNSRESFVQLPTSSRSRGKRRVR